MEDTFRPTISSAIAEAVQPTASTAQMMLTTSRRRLGWAGQGHAGKIVTGTPPRRHARR